MKTKRPAPEISSGSMADIAFLLLTFYMMTTVIQDNKGLAIMLPPFQSHPIQAPIPSRDLFTIQVNSGDHIMAEGEQIKSLVGLRKEIKKFILNKGEDIKSSRTPEKAVVSIKTDRGTSYLTYISVLDEAQAAYYEIYADIAGVTATEFRLLDLSIPEQRKLYEKARTGIPMNISIAEPTGVPE